MNTKITVTTPGQTQTGSRETGLGDKAGYSPAAMSVSCRVNTKHESMEEKAMNEWSAEQKRAWFKVQ